MHSIEQTISKTVNLALDDKLSAYLNVFRELIDKVPNTENEERWVSYKGAGLLIGVSEMTMKRYVKEAGLEKKYLLGKTSVRIRTSEVLGLLKNEVLRKDIAEQKVINGKKVGAKTKVRS